MGCCLSSCCECHTPKHVQSCFELLRQSCRGLKLKRTCPQSGPHESVGNQERLLDINEIQEGQVILDRFQVEEVQVNGKKNVFNVHSIDSTFEKYRMTLFEEREEFQEIQKLHRKLKEATRVRRHVCRIAHKIDQNGIMAILVKRGGKNLEEFKKMRDVFATDREQAADQIAKALIKIEGLHVKLPRFICVEFFRFEFFCTSWEYGWKIIDLEGFTSMNEEPRGGWGPNSSDLARFAGASQVQESDRGSISSNRFDSSDSENEEFNRLDTCVSGSYHPTIDVNKTLDPESSRE